jgi:peptide/nickel transport system substrate-binding protein
MKALSVLKWLIPAFFLAACGGGGAEPTATPIEGVPPTATSPVGVVATPTPVVIAPTAPPISEEPRYGGILTTGYSPGSVANGEWGPVPIGVSASVSGAGNTGVGRSGLLAIDPFHDNEVVGDTVERWEFTSDNSKLTLHVRPGVKWHDGTPFTARDVAYTLRYYLNPPQGYNTATQQVFLAPAVKDIVELDDETVEVQLKQLPVSFLPRFAGGGMNVLPAHLDLPTVSKRAIGTGPFKLKSFERDVVADWERNPDYYLKDEQGRQLPYLDGVRFFQFADLNLEYSAMRIGRLRHTWDAVLDRFYKEFEAQGITVDFVMGGTWGMYLRNIPPFTDRGVLEAIDLWFDRKLLLDVAYQGIGWPWDAGMIPLAMGGQWGLPTEEIMSRPGFRYLDASGKLVTDPDEARVKWDELRKDPADLERAKALLREGGIKPGDVKVTILTPPIYNARLAIPFSTGIKELFGATWPVDSQADADNRFLREQFSAAALAITGYGVDEPGISFSNFLWGRGTTRNVKSAGWPENDPYLSKISQLFDEQEFTFDAQKRRELIWEMQRALLDFRGRISTHGNQVLRTWWPELRGYPEAVTWGSPSNYDRVWFAK